MTYMHLEIPTDSGELELLKSTYISLCLHRYTQINTQNDIPITSLHPFTKNTSMIRSVQFNFC